MLGILAIGLPLLAWALIWLKKRHRRKLDVQRAAASGFPTEQEKRGGARSATPDLWGPHQVCCTRIYHRRWLTFVSSTCTTPKVGSIRMTRPSLELQRWPAKVRERARNAGIATEIVLVPRWLRFPKPDGLVDRPHREDNHRTEAKLEILTKSRRSTHKARTCLKVRNGVEVEARNDLTKTAIWNGMLLLMNSISGDSLKSEVPGDGKTCSNRVVMVRSMNYDVQAIYFLQIISSSFLSFYPGFRNFGCSRPWSTPSANELRQLRAARIAEIGPHLWYVFFAPKLLLNSIG
jgi:hypothetical protein